MNHLFSSSSHLAHKVAPSDQPGCGGHDADAMSSGECVPMEVDAENEDDDNIHNFGFAAFLKLKNAPAKPVAAKASSSKPAATKAVAPKPKPKAKVKAETKSAAMPKKTIVGNAGGKSHKRKACDAGLASDPFACDNVSGSALGLADGDQQVIEQFDQKIDPLLTISPPVPDDAFKHYLADRINSITTIANDLKNKRKSAGRRRNLSDADQQFADELTTLEQKLRTLVKTLTCILS